MAKSTRKKTAKTATCRKSVDVSPPSYSPPTHRAKRTPELEDRILQRVGAGESLRKACDGEDIDESSVREWAVRDPGFGARLTTARVIQAHSWFDQIREELARPVVLTQDGRIDHGDVQLRRLRCDVLRWGLSKLLPANFGDKLTVAGDAEAPLHFMSDAECMHEIMGLLATAKTRQMRDANRTGVGNGQARLKEREAALDEPPVR